jgi:hypothetical protein
MSLYDMDRRAAEAEATSKNAQNELNRALSAARTAGNREAFTYWSGVQDDMMKVDPAYQQRFLQWVINGRNPAQIPPGGWPAVQKDVRIQRYNSLLSARKQRMQGIEALPTDQQQKAAEEWNARIATDPELSDTEKSTLMFGKQMGTAAMARVAATTRGQNINAQQREADRALRASIARESADIRRRANDIAAAGVRVREEAARAKQEGKKYTPPKELVTSVVKGVAEISKSIQKYEALAAKPINWGEKGQWIRDAIAAQRAAYKQIIQAHSDRFDFYNQDSGLPLAVPKSTPGGGNPPNPPSPRPGGSPGAETNVDGVRIRVNVR